MRALLLACVVALSACDSCNGGRGQSCYPNSTCDADMRCYRVPKDEAGKSRTVCAPRSEVVDVTATSAVPR